LAFLAESHLPKTFWDEACLTSCYLINRLPTPLLKNQSPFQTLFKHTADYTFLKIFGCACFPNLRPYNSHKFSLRSKERIVLGYSPNHKGYKSYHIESGRMYISRDVVFHETKFPFVAASSHTESFAAQPAPFFPPLHIPAHTPTLPTPPCSAPDFKT